MTTAAVLATVRQQSFIVLCAYSRAPQRQSSDRAAVALHSPCLRTFTKQRTVQQSCNGSRVLDTEAKVSSDILLYTMIAGAYSEKSGTCTILWLCVMLML